MGRKLFLCHLADASRLISHGIHDAFSLDEGIVTFTYLYPTSPFHKVNIEACATDLGEYPDGNSFMLCTADDSPHPSIPKTLQTLTENAHGKSLLDLLSEVSESLTTAISAGSSLEDASDYKAQDDDDDDDDEFDFDFEGDSDNDCFGLGDNKPVSCAARDIVFDSGTPSDNDMKKVEKIRADLNALKNSGYRIGVFGHLTSSGILCVSIRISKLGLSDEALEAWSIPRKCYLVLLIRYPRGYRDAARVADDKDLTGLVQMRVGLCKNYKPSLRHVLSAFQHAKSDGAASKEQAKGTADEDHVFEPFFVGKALNQFLEERFFKIITARHLYRLTWLGAEKFIAERQASASTSDIGDLKPYHCDDVANANSLPAIVLADHLRQVPLSQASLPLIAMQFVLRHVVRCTEFCLVCHCRVDDSFEALKPYVCLKPLCLYQYMTLGFGPSLEWEILVQPYVVDLLISFCYAAAYSGRLKEMPVGMNLTVPVTPLAHASGATDPMAYSAYSQRRPSQNITPPALVEKSFTCSWDMSLQCLTVEKDDEESNAAVKKLKSGDWVVLLSKENRAAAHFRVKGIDLPQIFLQQPIFVPFRDYGTDFAEVTEEDGKTSPVAADCYLYDKNFDDIPNAQQQGAIITLLDALPGVIDMRRYLERQGRTQDSSLKAWTDRISDSALNLLRWIIASNRSCILQVDEIGGDENCSSPGKPEDRVSGMDGWMQFRFAQGAPDKEKRFNDCVQKHAQATGTIFPTLFAWHGSRIGNWHAIIRQGLRYDEVVNGRAYGDGVYMSPNASESLAYSHPRGYDAGMGITQWKPSALRIANALSLQEVVNDPKQFRSSNPHYVVADIDWIQTRYLFVTTKVAPVPKHSLAANYEQDPARLAYSEHKQAISIPITAISKSRRPGNSIQATASPQGKRTKIMCKTDQATAERQEDDADSVVSDAEDLALLSEAVQKYDLALRGSDASAESPVVNDKKRPAEPTAETDFVPGKLDLQGIKFMGEPQDATLIATKALMRLLKDALNTQENTPPANLGWYVDRNLINNMYQWIVELHSFPKDLPLAKDMKAAELTSIVMEMRFTSQYPFSPPFIRVVKPRFMPFNQGGGGNVTEGGALCMEVLTNNGWSAGLTIESLLLQVRLAIGDTERPARLAPNLNSVDRLLMALEKPSKRTSAPVRVTVGGFQRDST